MWPRSQALALARQEGLEALLALAGRRVEACSAGSSSAAGSAVAAEAQAALGAVAGEVEALRQRSAHAARQGAVRALQLAAQAQRKGLQGAEAAAVRLLGALATLPQPLYDGSAAAGELAAAAGAFGGSEDFRAALQALVLRCAAQQPAACVALVRACSQQQGLQHRLAAAAATGWLEQGAGKHLHELVQLALAVPAQPELQEHLVGAAGAAAKQDASGQLARACLPLIRDLEAQPRLQALLAEAAAAPLLANAATSAQACVALALELPPGRQPQLQQQLVSGAAEGLRASPAAVLHQAEPLVALVAGLAQRRELQAQLAAVVGGALVSAGAAPNARACIGLAAVLPAGDLQNGLVAAVSAGLRSWTGPALLCDGCLALLGPLRQLPHLQAHLAGALADALLRSDAAVAAQPEQGLLQLSDMLLGRPELAATHYGRFASGVASRADSAGLIGRLLASQRVAAALELPGVQRLVEAQVVNLQALCSPSQFSWRMPQAQLPAYPEVGGGGRPLGPTAASLPVDMP
jgi:hypothetical protein